MVSLTRCFIGASCLLLASCASTPDKGSDAQGNTSLSAADYLHKGNMAYSRGEFEQAEVNYLVALNTQPRSPEALFRIGTVYKAKNQIKEAVQSFEAALALDPLHNDSREALGLILLKSGDTRGAHKHLKELAIRDKSRWRVFDALGVVYDMQQYHTQARSFYQLALDLNPRSAHVLNNLGYSYYLSGDWDNARQHYTRATSLDPKSDYAWSNLGLYYVMTGNYSEAEHAFEQFLQPHQAANNIGYISMLRANFDKAEEYFSKAIKLSPRYYPQANANLHKLQAMR